MMSIYKDILAKCKKCALKVRKSRLKKVFIVQSSFLLRKTSNCAWFLFQPSTLHSDKFLALPLLLQKICCKALLIFKLAPLLFPFWLRLTDYKRPSSFNLLLLNCHIISLSKRASILPLTLPTRRVVKVI